MGGLIGDLRQQVEVLRAQNHQLRQQLADVKRRGALEERRPNGNERRILCALAEKGIQSYGELTDVLEPAVLILRDRRRDDLFISHRCLLPGGARVLRVTMCRLRRKIAPFNIEILTIRAFGFRLEEPSRSRLAALLDHEWRAE